MKDARIENGEDAARGNADEEKRTENGTGRAVWKAGAITGPVPPALVTCAENGRVNVITVAWTGILCSKPPVTYISVRPERFSHGIIDRTGEFVINFPNDAIARQTDLCGMLSGRKVDKIEKCGFHLLPGSEVSVPVIAECPLSVECRVIERKDLGSHNLFMAEIVATQADERYVDEKGKLVLRKAGMLAYLHGEYFATGRKCGRFGFSVAKKGKK